jgi:hypothetical protein
VASDGWNLYDAAGTGHAVVYKAAGSTDVNIANCFETTKATNILGTYTKVADGTSLLNLYCDNTSTSSAIAVAPIANSAEDLKIGGAAGEYMPGSIGRCAFWNRALTAQESKSWAYPYFPPNSYGTTTYTRACTQAIPEATCWQDKCRNAKANTCAVEPTGVFGSFLSNTELLRDNSFETYTFTPIPTGAFAAFVAYGNTRTAMGIAIDDFNADGYDDIVAGNYALNTVSVLLNTATGAGAFAVKVDYTSGNFPVDVATGDFRKNGMRDIAVATENMTMAVLLGDGDGTFNGIAKTDYAVTGTLSGIVVADFDEDTYDDIAVTDYTNNRVEVFINVADGSGTFHAKVSYACGANPKGIAVGDFHGTGAKDIVVTNYTANTISILPSDGDGTFSPAETYASGVGPYGIVVGDFRGAGVKDIAATNYTDGDISIFLGIGDGTFAGKVDYATNVNPRGIAVGDFRGLGRDDITVASAVALPNKMHVFLGVGDGTFNAKVDYTAATPTYDIAVGDFRNNGVRDIVASVSTPAVDVFLGNYTSTDDSNPTLTRWTKVETGSGDVTTYHANNRHGLTTARLKTVGIGTAKVTSTCQTVGVGSDLFVYASVNKLSSTAAFSVELNEYSDGACTVLIGTSVIKSTSNLLSRWQTVTKHITAADWDPTPTASYTLTFKETGAAGITTDILLDTVSAKAQKYYTPWIENPSGSVTTTASARVLDLNNPLAPTRYTLGFCAGGWVWTDWDGTNTDALRYFMSVPATAGFLNKWAIYYAVAPSVRLGFEVYTSGPGNYRVYLSGIGATEWSAHNWHYLEACYKPSSSSLTRVIKARHYNVANATWYNWSTTDHTGNLSQNGQSTTLSIGQAVGVGQPNAYLHQPYILPYSDTYPDTFFNNGKPPALPYGSFNND